MISNMFERVQCSALAAASLAARMRDKSFMLMASVFVLGRGISRLLNSVYTYFLYICVKGAYSAPGSQAINPFALGD